MKTFLFFAVIALLPVKLLASVDMTRIRAGLFIPQPETDFTIVELADTKLKKKLVRELFDQDLLNHEGTKAYDMNASFEAYYRLFSARYHIIDMNADGIPEIIFSGYVTSDDDRERFEVYVRSKGKLQRMYDQIGHLLAYRIQPNTGEVLLYHHQYPCCLNASHNINRLRLVEGKLQLLKKYFVAREAGDMKGAFFPEASVFDGKYAFTEKVVSLRWSPEVLVSGAWEGRTGENIVARYPDSSVYRVLARKNGWLYVLMHSAPSGEANKVINPVNFEDVAVFGWLQESAL